ncbi:hypothetical protein HMPREF9988_12375, partial [Staphylococcus epidermidis NIHLM053]
DGFNNQEFQILSGNHDVKDALKNYES